MLVGGEGGGRLLGSTSRWIQALLLRPFVGQRLRPLSTRPNQADLRTIGELVEAGALRPVLDRTYPLAEVPDAIRYLRLGRARGKIVVAVRGAEEPAGGAPGRGADAGAQGPTSPDSLATGLGAASA